MSDTESNVIFDIPVKASKDAHFDWDFIAQSAIPRDVVGEWLLSLADGRSVQAPSQTHAPQQRPCGISN